MSEEKIEVKVLSLDYIVVKPSLKAEETHTLITAQANDRFITLEIERKVEDADELKEEILKEVRKPRPPLEGLTFEV